MARAKFSVQKDYALRKRKDGIIHERFLEDNTNSDYYKYIYSSPCFALERSTLNKVIKMTENVETIERAVSTTMPWLKRGVGWLYESSIRGPSFMA